MSISSLVNDLPGTLSGFATSTGGGGSTQYAITGILAMLAISGLGVAYGQSFTSSYSDGPFSDLFSIGITIDDLAPPVPDDTAINSMRISMYATFDCSEYDGGSGNSGIRIFGSWYDKEDTNISNIDSVLNPTCSGTELEEHTLEKTYTGSDVASVDRWELEAAHVVDTPNPPYEITGLLIEVEYGCPDGTAAVNGACRPTITKTYTSAPEITIPDQDSSGVDDTISISDVGLLKNMSVDVTVTHSCLDDVEAYLTAGDATATVGPPDGCSSDGSPVTLTSTTHYDTDGHLDFPQDMAIGQDWVLNIRDDVPDNEGTLDSWSLTLEYVCPDGHLIYGDSCVDMCPEGTDESDGTCKGAVFTYAGVRDYSLHSWDLSDYSLTCDDLKDLIILYAEGVVPADDISCRQESSGTETSYATPYQIDFHAQETNDAPGSKATQHTVDGQYTFGYDYESAALQITSLVSDGALLEDDTLVYVLRVYQNGEFLAQNTARFDISAESMPPTATVVSSYHSAHDPPSYILEGALIEDTIKIADPGTVSGVGVGYALSHTNPSDVDASLYAPNSDTTSALASPAQCNDTLEYCVATTSHLHEDLYAIYGIAVAGDWRFQMGDTVPSGDSGTLRGWSLHIEHECPIGYLVDGNACVITCSDSSDVVDHGVCSEFCSDATHEVYDGVCSEPDTRPPTIVAPGDITLEAAAELTLVNLGVPEVRDDRDLDPEITNDSPPLDMFPVGITPVTWFATDSAGNTATALQQVNITDTTAPRFIEKPQDITRLAYSDSGTTVAFDTPAAKDIADQDIVVTSSHSSGDTFPVGITTVTFTVQDDSGNEAATSFDIEIIRYDGTLYVFSYPPMPTSICIDRIVTDPGEDGPLTDTYHNLHVALESQQGHMFELEPTYADATDTEDPTLTESPVSVRMVYDDADNIFRYHGSPALLDANYCFVLSPMHTHHDGSFAERDGTFVHPVYIFGTKSADNTAEYSIVGQFDIQHTVKQALDMNYYDDFTAFHDIGNKRATATVDLAKFVKLRGSLVTDGSVAYEITSHNLHTARIDSGILTAAMDADSVNHITITGTATVDGVKYTDTETYKFKVRTLPYGATYAVPAFDGAMSVDLSLETYHGFECASDTANGSQNGNAYGGTFSGTTTVTCSGGPISYSFDVVVERLPYFATEHLVLLNSVPPEYSFFVSIYNPEQRDTFYFCREVNSAEPTLAYNTTSTSWVMPEPVEDVTIKCFLHSDDQRVDDKTFVVPGSGNAGGSGQQDAPHEDGPPDRLSSKSFDGWPSGAGGQSGFSEGAPTYSEMACQDTRPSAPDSPTMREHLTYRIDLLEHRICVAQDTLDNTPEHMENRINKLTAKIEHMNNRIDILQDRLDSLQ